MSALPTYKFEIAFNAGPTTPAASRTWTDVTQWMLLGSGIEIDYGRSDWRSNADANSLRLTLNNSDGRFTAGRTASPYYPNVKIGRPIRVTATLNGSASTRFVGFIDEWPVEWPATVGTFATATLTANSRLAWLGNRVELRSIIEEEILPDSPVVYYVLGEPLGSRVAFDSSGNNAPSLGPYDNIGSLATFGQATGPTTDGLTAVTFASGTHRYLGTQGAFVLDDVPLTMECFFAMGSVPSVAGDLMSLYSPEVSIGIGIRSDGFASAGYAGAVFVNGTTNLCDGAIHHVSATASRSGGTGTLELFVDGVSVASNSGAVATGSPFVLLNVGSMGGSTATLTVAHAAVFDAVLSSTRIAAHAGAGLTGFTGETPAARLTRYASYAKIAATEVSAETGMVPDLAHIDTTGKTAVDLMRSIEATEEGVLFDAQDGALTFHARNHRYSAASAFTLNVPTGQVDVGISPRLDRSVMRNDVSAQTTDGKVVARALNQAGIDDYGPARESLDLATTNAEEPFQHASWLVGTYGTPIPRVPQLGVKLANLPLATAQAVLAAGIGTRSTVTGMPSQAQKSSQDYFIEGYSERIGSGYHDFAFNVSQAEPFDVWILDDSAYSVLGTTTRLAF